MYVHKTQYTIQFLQPEYTDLNCYTNSPMFKCIIPHYIQVKEQRSYVPPAVLSYDTVMFCNYTGHCLLFRARYITFLDAACPLNDSPSWYDNNCSASKQTRRFITINKTVRPTYSHLFSWRSVQTPISGSSSGVFLPGLRPTHFCAFLI
jgi:hypothetical protein